MLEKSASCMYKSIMPIRNVYVHLPFCKKKCHFCAFPIHAIGSQSNDEAIQQYISKLNMQIKISSQYTNLLSPLSSLYLGGGTPSLHSATQIKSIMDLFSIDSSTQVTLQINPSQLSLLGSFMQVGCNRISLGIQTFNTQLLAKMNRYKASDYNRHKMQEQVFKNRPINLSVDFILNICLEQHDWNQVLTFIRQVKPEHVTLYILQINQGSNIHRLSQNFKWLPKQQPVVNRYIQACQQLKQMGYEHYQVSNFALSPQLRSKHSSAYWEGDCEFLAYGMGATSLLKGIRATRPKTLQKYYKYVESLKNGRQINMDELNIEVHEQMIEKIKLQTVLMSRFRLKEGISWQRIFYISQKGQLKQILLKKLQQIQSQRRGLINWQLVNKGIVLTDPWGFLLADQIIYQLVAALS